jgi:hypothetical protein
MGRLDSISLLSPELSKKSVRKASTAYVLKKPFKNSYEHQQSCWGLIKIPLSPQGSPPYRAFLRNRRPGATWFTGMGVNVHYIEVLSLRISIQLICFHYLGLKVKTLRWDLIGSSSLVNISKNASNSLKIIQNRSQSSITSTVTHHVTVTFITRNNNTRYKWTKRPFLDLKSLLVTKLGFKSVVAYK